MPRIVRSALVPHRTAVLFELVSDVGRYPEFLPWCTAAEVLSRSDEAMLASLTIEKGRLCERVTTRGALRYPESIELDQVEGPFRRFHGVWTFTGLGESGCKVEFDVDYELDRGILQRAFSVLFANVAGSVVDAFCVRARAMTT